MDRGVALVGIAEEFVVGAAVTGVEAGAVDPNTGAPVAGVGSFGAWPNGLALPNDGGLGTESTAGASACDAGCAGLPPNCI